MMDVRSIVERANLAKGAGASFHLSEDELTSVLAAAAPLVEEQVWKYRYIDTLSRRLIASGMDNSDQAVAAACRQAERAWVEEDDKLDAVRCANAAYFAIADGA